tara:strand:- start:2573 stop:3403 length:831 start_codon:yes stop_codon:yes gene_type:complete
VADISFKEPIVFQANTGVTVNLSGTELFGKQARSVDISIGQAVAKTSDVVFNQLTTSPVIIDNGNLRLNSNTITGSFTQTGNLIVSSNFTNNGNLTVDGTLTAEKIESALTQSVTLFESGSTVFGDTLDDNHYITGSMLTTGSLTLNAYKITEISDDTTLADSSTTATVTENAIETYATLNTTTIQTYQRKSFAHTGSFVSVSTASFSALSASAPSGYTGTTVNDFMFFLNGAIMENDSLNIEQSGSTFLLKVNNSTLGYNLEVADEIVSFGKFNS